LKAQLASLSFHPYFFALLDIVVIVGRIKEDVDTTDKLHLLPQHTDYSSLLIFQAKQGDVFHRQGLEIRADPGGELF